MYINTEYFPIFRSLVLMAGLKFVEWDQTLLHSGQHINIEVRIHFSFSLSCIGEGNGNPLQCSCMENPRDGGAWRAAVYGVAQSRT